MKQKVVIRESEWSAKNVFRYFVGTVAAIISIPVLFLLDTLDAVSVRRQTNRR